MYKHLLLLAATVVAGTTAASAQQLFTSGTPGKYIAKVIDYSPAPGQFVNKMPEYETGDNDEKMAQKCTDLISGTKGEIVTLGAFGGSITFRFDHSIANIDAQKDFIVSGNAITDSSEPGIVMVSKDVNRNGIADDPWYELAGSADKTHKALTTYKYRVTYTADPLKNIPWTDNQGASGTIDRNMYHAQEYYPLWKPTTITVEGTRLPSNIQRQGAMYLLKPFEYGYVDNQPNSNQEANAFDIDWAVDENRNPVKLDFIDFVKVYTAMQQKAGWLGETSTEITGAEDLHLEASLAAIAKANEATTATFDDVAPTLLNADGYYIGSIAGEKFTGSYGEESYKCRYTSGSYRFTVNYTPSWSSWSGIALSNRTAKTFQNITPDQYNACTGSGYDNSANYAVAYITDAAPLIEVTNKADGDNLKGVYITNSAWVVNAIKSGDGMSRGATGKYEFETGDWLKLTITGKKTDGSETSTEVYLADYRSANTAEHYYIGNWQWVDLSALGTVKSLAFSISGSRSNAYGLTTPTYFCMDNLNAPNDGNNGKVTGIAEVNNSPINKTETARFTVDGKRIYSPVKGINIIKYSDGTVQKVVVK